ncbi:hydantoinase/oxoprolinase family protein [Paracoccus sp. (in: a-proteobacteria)]|uniref:hydantoinase/oxoprolinase family protein n=1 Tax=Paracoccus sp. TaxID=267 RepID=UPI003A8845A5
MSKNQTNPAGGTDLSRVRVAVDVGGTFVDAVLTDMQGRGLAAAKVPTTPEDRAIGVMNGIAAVCTRAGIAPENVAEVVHGSTTGTNALIERTGAKVGFLTTKGFRDVLEIGRVMRPMAGLYDITVDRPPPLVPRALCREAVERMDAQGEVVTLLDEASVMAAAQAFRAEGVEAVAICFLFSYLNPDHERRAAAIMAQALPGMPVSLSSEISPEYREYERASTTVMNAFLSPVMRAYLQNLEDRLAQGIGAARLSVIQANGGSTSVGFARERAVTTVNSGPAGGVVAAAYYGRLHDRDRIVSVDMGGTSFDIGLIEGGASRVTTEGDFQGLPVKIPIIDLHIIGAGGGSVAWIDPGGALNVGPRSAGAEPGPACYGRGGTEPTVTDANLVLGRLNPDNFNAGQMVLDRDAARLAVGRLADSMGVSIEEAALGIIRIVNANMTRGIAAVTIQRGIDLRDFTLFSFGGAGGVHAVELAQELQMAEAIIPPLPGTFSAVGLLATEMRHDYVDALGGVIAQEADPADLEARFKAMEAQGHKELARQGFGADAIRTTRLADLKVVGQTYELLLPLPDQGRLGPGGVAALLAAFGDLYRDRYAFFFEDEPVEIVNLRVSAEGINPAVIFPETGLSGPDPSVARTGARQVFFAGTGWTETPVFRREALTGGMRVSGPAMIEEETSATLIPPGITARVAADHGLIIDLKGAGRETGT